jgi:hypothetical protein
MLSSGGLRVEKGNQSVKAAPAAGRESFDQLRESGPGIRVAWSIPLGGGPRRVLIYDVYKLRMYTHNVD